MYSIGTEAVVVVVVVEEEEEDLLEMCDKPLEVVLLLFEEEGLPLDVVRLLLEEEYPLEVEEHPLELARLLEEVNGAFSPVKVGESTGLGPDSTLPFSSKSRSTFRCISTLPNGSSRPLGVTLVLFC